MFQEEKKLAKFFLSLPYVFMRKLPDMTLESARRRFRTSIIVLVLAVIYLISPIDLIPGPPPFEWIEDIPLLVGALIYSGFTYYSLKRRRAGGDRQ